MNASTFVFKWTLLAMKLISFYLLLCLPYGIAAINEVICAVQMTRKKLQKISILYLLVLSSIKFY